MKTFTNLAHRAFKKCASLGTINKKRYYLFIITMLLTLGVGNAWAENAPVNTVLWGENFAHFGTNTPSNAKTGTGTTIYDGASITYTQSNTKTKAYNETLAGGTAPELLLSKSNETWTISGIKTGGATKMTLTFLSNKTTFSVTVSSASLSVSGSQKSWTITLKDGQTVPETFDLTIKNTGGSNARIDNVELKVTVAGTNTEPVTTYSVTLNQPLKGGTIEADKDEAAKDATVTLTATPAEGYKFGAWDVKDASSNSVSVDANGQFTMPESNVTVTASFVAKTQYTISWSVNETTKTLSPANVYEGDALGTLPTPDPSDICTGKVFVGWTTEANKDYTHATDAPEFITKDTKPSANTTYYAVFATETSTSGNVEMTISITNDVLIENLTTSYGEDKSFIHDGYTFYLNACVQQEYCQMRDNSTISFIQIPTLPGPITKISCTDCKNASGIAYSGTLHFKSSKTRGNSDTDDIDKITYTSVNSFEWEINNETHKTGYLLTSAGLRLKDLSITYITEGNTTTYSDYTTSCGATPTIYNVTIAGDIQNGTVTASPTSAAEGATITLTVTPADGYMLNTLAVADESSNSISVTDNKFEMPASNVTVSATFEEIPAATLTLSKNGDTSDKIEGKVGDVITLPDFTSDCSKTFVGWDADANCATEPEYKAGNSYTLSATEQTLYAVYANAIEGALVNVFSETFDDCGGKGANNGEAWSGTGIATATLTLDEWNCVKGNAANGCAKFGTGSAKGSAETPAIALTGNATLTFRAGAWNGNSEQTTLNISAIGATLSQTSVTLIKGAWTEYTIYVTEATGSVKIKFEASVEEDNRFFLDDVVVSQASVTYSDYSTTCTAALDAPTFNPAAGTYNEETYVTISATDGDVYYTLDGTTPTEESHKYTAPIVLNTNGTTTIKAIAISGVSQSSVVTATYTIKLPLTTMDEIFDAATTAGGVEAPVLITMNNWVITGVKGSNAYLTDGTKGLIIYTASHGFNVGDILSGTVACNVQLFKGSAELTGLTATTEGLSITTGGTVSTVVVDDVTTLSGINTGSVIKINGVCETANTIAGVKLYNTLFDFEDLELGQEYNVTGIYLQYNTTPEVLPRSAEDIEEVVGLPTATISIADITMEVGQEKTIEATITPDAAASTVTYAITSGTCVTLEGNKLTAEAEGTAIITATIAESAGVYYGATKEFTVTVTPLNIAALPFMYDGNGTDASDVIGITADGVGDYNSTPKIKFDTQDDYLIIHFDSEPDKLSYDIKGNGFSGGTFSVQESADGETYTTIATYTELEGTTSEEKELSSDTRYVKFIYTTKDNGNVALGNISITKPDTRAEAGIAWSTDAINLTVGDAFTAPTFNNPNELSGITFASSNEALATVNNAGAITLVSGKTGTATITATFADGHATYKPAEATCVITVSPKSEKVVILAQYNGQWYALQAAYFSTYTNRLAALPVNYVGGKLYNVEEADKATIEWQLAISATKATFKNGENYLTGTNGTDLKLGTATFEWDYNGELFLTDGDSRTFIYHKDGYFRNYATSNAIPNSTIYSNKPVVTAPVYATGDAYSRSTTAGKFGTICLPFGGEIKGAELYEVAGKETGKVFLDEATTLEAGVPYIFLATATELAVYSDGTTATASNKNGLYGTFDDNTPVLEGMYIVYDNELRLCGTGCTINANRAYLNLNEVTTNVPEPMPGRRRVAMGVTGENQTTGFENITAPEGKATKVLRNGQIIIIRNGQMYNAQGQKL